MLFNSKDIKLFLKSRCYDLDSWSRYSLKLFFTHFNAGPLAKGVANHSLEIGTPKSPNVSLSCWIDYDDCCPGKLRWEFNDKPLPEIGKKYKYILKDTNSKCLKKFILSIFDVTESDEGTYSCHWLCDYEKSAKAAIDLKVDDETGRNFFNSSFTIKSLPQ